MKSPIRSRKARASAVLFVLLASGAVVPLLSGGSPGTVMPLLSGGFPGPDAAQGSADLFDAAVRRAADHLHGVAGTDDLNPLLDLDAVDVPATFFHDRFDDLFVGGTNEDERTGGFGNWTEGLGWHLDESAAGHDVEYGYVPMALTQCVNNDTLGVNQCTATEQPVHERGDIDRGYRFGGQGGYDIPGAFTTVDTPLINLQSLPELSVPPERRNVPGYGGVGYFVGTTPNIDQQTGIRDESDLTLQNRVPATGGPSDPGHIVLYIDHRFNLAYAPTTSATGPVVGASHFASVVLQTEQNRRALESGSGVACMPASCFEQLQPLRAENSVSMGSSSLNLNQMPPTASLPLLVFSGSQREFTEEAFDLTPWAGQDVHLYFRVQTSLRPGPPDFNDDTLFDTGAGFYGWDVSNVRIEGPAHRHNVRLDRVLYPNVGTGVSPVSLGSDPFSVLVLNRGQVEEDVQVTMTARGFNETMVVEVECSVDVTLGSGGAREVDMLADGDGCLEIQSDWTYNVTVNATTALDLYPADNELRFTVKGKAPDIRLAERIRASRSLAARDDPVGLIITLHNAALDVQTVVLDLSAHWTPVGNKPTKKWEQGRNLTSDVYSKLVTVPAGADHTVVWPVQASKAGLYTLHVNASRPDNGESFFEMKSVNLGVLTAPDLAFRDSFDDVGNISTAVQFGTKWEAESRVNVEPPCTEVAGVDVCYAKVLEMSNKSLPAHTTVGLRGEFLPHPDRRDVPIANVQVEILHYAEDLRCRSAGCNTPEESLSVRVVDRQPLPQDQRVTTHPTAGTTALAPGQWANTILNVGGTATRNAYYNGQWIAEDILVPVTNLQYESALGGPIVQDAVGVNTIPAARLADMALDFVMSSSTCPKDDRACPLWRVAKIRVTAHPEDSEQATMTLLEWSGVEPDEGYGNLFSYFVSPSSQTGVLLVTARFYPDPSPFIATLGRDNEAGTLADDDDNGDHPLYDHLDEPLFPIVLEDGTVVGNGRLPCSSVPPIHFTLEIVRDTVVCPFLIERYYGGQEDDRKWTPFDYDDQPLVSEGCDLGSVQNETDRRFRCPTWELRDVDEFRAPHATWHLDEDLGSYTHAKPSANNPSIYKYEDRANGTLEYLLSPALGIPQTYSNLTINHGYKLHPYDANEFGTAADKFSSSEAASPSFIDSAMLMVRFLDSDAQDVKPVTPFMPVWLPPRQATPLNPPVQNFRTGAAQTGAAQMEELKFELHNFMYLDYRQAQPLTTRDLTQCTDEDGEEAACIVQFAFRLELPPPVHGDARNSARAQLPNGGAEGWFINAMSISEATAVPFDLSVIGVNIETEGYDWTQLGFGPGGEAEAKITVQNDGIFPLSEVAFNVTLQDANDASVRFHYEVRPEDGFSAPPGGQDFANVTFDLPAEGTYVMSFCAFVVGELEPNILLEDDPADDCLVLEHVRPGQDPVFHPSGVLTINEATQTHELELDLVDIVANVKSNEVLEFNMDIQPRQGRTSDGSAFARDVDIIVQNRGNVVVYNRVLERQILPVGGTATIEKWRISESPKPGQDHDESWTNLALKELVSEEDKPADELIHLREAGVYFVTASLSGCAACSQSIKLVSFDTIYSNTFKPMGGGIHSDIGIRDPVEVHESKPPGTGPAWRSTTGLGIEQDDTRLVRMLQFGDPAIDQYLDNTDAVVALPPTDLSNFRSSSLVITHNYDLEKGYDGARAEACIGGPDVCGLDDATWHVLVPESGALGAVAAHGPFVPDNDPTDSDLNRAFTGSSRDRAPERNGWVIDEFDMSRLPGFARDVTFERFSQEHMAGSRGDPAFSPSSDRNSTHPTWAIGGGSCPDDCWHRENLNKMNPPPLDGQGGYWWTPGSYAGSPGGASRADILEAYVNATVPEGWQARINFTAWKMSGTGAVFVFDPDDYYGPDPDRRLKQTVGSSAADHSPTTYGGNIRFYREDLCGPPIPIPLDRHNVNRPNDRTFCTRQQLSGWGTEDISMAVERKTVPGEARYNLSVEWLFEPAQDRFTRGMAIGNVRMEVFRPNFDGSETIHEVIPFLRNNTITPKYGFYDGTLNNNHNNWAFVSNATATPEDWGIATVETRTGAPGNVWRFGHLMNPANPTLGTTYEEDAWERLVTPRIDLSNIVGNELSLTYFENRCLHGNDRARILVQAITPAPPPVGERAGAWQQVDESSGGSCVWGGAPREIMLNAETYKGTTIRVAFEAQTTNMNPANWNQPRAGWLIDEVTITGGSLVGEPVQLRLRAGTDDSIHEGHWKIQELQLVGIKYGGNVAVLPDEPLVDRSIRRSGTMELTGQLRNLGREQVVRLQLAVGGNADGPEVEVCTHAPTSTSEWACTSGNGAVTGTEKRLFAVGQSFDRLDYRVNITFPDVQRGYEFALRLVDGSGNPLVNDENFGDHEHRFVVAAINERGVLQAGLSADPPTVNLEENATLRLDAWLVPHPQTGPATLTNPVNVMLNVTQLDGGDGIATNITAVPVTVTVGPDGTTSLTWNWSTPEPGFYRFAAAVDGAGLLAGQRSNAYAHVMVGMTPLYFQDDFSQDPFENGWGRTTTAPMWAVSDDFGGQSLFVGAMEGMYGPGTSIATTPSIGNLSWLVKDGEEGKGEQAIRDGSSVFAPRFAMAYQPRFDGMTAAMGHAVELQVRRGAADPLPFASSVQFSGSEENAWRIATTPLYTDDDDHEQGMLRFKIDKKNTATTPLLNGGADSRFAFTFAPPTSGQQGFAIDRVSISSYNAVVEPSNQTALLQVGSEKSYYFRVENTGAARDTYAVDVRTSGLHLVDVEVIPEELALEAGQTGFVEVRVRVPYENLFVGFGGALLSVDIASTNDLTRVATGTVTFEDASKDLADFETTLRRPVGALDPVAGDQAMFIVDVLNDGDRTTLPTDVVLFTCPEPEFPACMDADADPKPFVIGTRRLPALDFGESSSPTFSWILPVNTTGNQIIVAVADPLKIVPEYDPANSIDFLELFVAPLDWPDLYVHDLRVLDAAGNNVTHAFARDHLTIEATLTNDGNAVARGVGFEIKNGDTLIDQELPELAPGDSVQLRTTWIAETGNWLVIAQAQGEDPELDALNNVQDVRLTVQEGRLEARLDSSALSLERGDDAEATLTLKNHRDQDLLLGLAAVTSDREILVQGLPGAVEVARGATVEIPLLVKATPFAGSGQHDVRIEAVSGGDMLASVDLEVFVDVHRAIRLTHPPVLATPGAATVDLAFTNDGDAKETLVLDLGAPAGWNATVLQPTLELEPGASRTVRVLLSIPPGTLPGRHGLAVHAGDLVDRIVPVEVTRQAAWRSTVETVSVVSGRIDALVRVENAGNIPGVPWFVLDDAAVPLGVDPSPSEVQPGQARSYVLSLSATATPPRLLLPGRDAPVPLEADPSSQAEPLGLTGPPGAVQAGEPVLVQARIQNREAQAQAVPVRLWVDGALIDERDVVLEAGETRTVELRWPAALAGQHALTVTTGAGDEAVGRTLVLEAAETKDVGIPGPGVLAVALVLAAVALARRRRL